MPIFKSTSVKYIYPNDVYAGGADEACTGFGLSAACGAAATEVAVELNKKRLSFSF